ncbi:Sodium/potassium/calcium exchanger 1 [Triplophysa tibetana]|uniref:Sodium/potassium/calcium exchanger 1 n=1 Tax=Triplophysa tibetana TaxID=1572043 RepID=A0A5A9PPQ7_9TELE|nr:Sodium/potassium/calcium exchanger 1 [Triplophysa tibetana]
MTRWFLFRPCLQPFQDQSSMNRPHGSRLRLCKTLTVLCVTLMCWICWLSLSRSQKVWKRSVHEQETAPRPEARTDLDMSPFLKILKTREYSKCIYISAKPKRPVNTSDVTRTPSAPLRTLHYPEDLFTLEQRRHGWVLLHIAALIYTFFALVFVCEEFFIPSLGILTEKLNVSSDLSAVNFMAAGGFVPEFFMSLTGLFLSSGRVGVGVVVGSGFFNVLVVTGACAAFSHDTLRLTWWPFSRDMMFYTCDVFILLVVLMDDIITWRESLSLLMGCVMYVTFIKHNEFLEESVKVYLQKHDNISKALAIDEPEKVSIRENIQQYLCSQTQQNLPDIKMKNNRESESSEEEEEEEDDEDDEDDEESDSSDGEDCDCSGDEEESSDSDDDEEEEEEDDEGVSNVALSLKWPEEKHKQASYVLLLPITGCLWLTLPDPRRQTSRQYFVVTLMGSLVWIGLFCYLMLCLSHRVSETVGVSEELMSVSVLSAGVSLPHLLTALLKAHKGSADTAVSNSMGMNVFDITLGLPVSWVISSAVSGGSVVSVSGGGLFFIVLLFLLTLISAVVCVAALRWRMNKRFGGVMLMSYFIFLFLSVLLV